MSVPVFRQMNNSARIFPAVLLAAVFLLLVPHQPFFAQETASGAVRPFAAAGLQSGGKDGSPFRISWLTDGLLTGSALAITGTAYLLEQSRTTELPAEFSLAAVNVFDRWAARPYSAPLDSAGTVFEIAAFLSPAILAVAPPDEWVTVGIMYAESALLSYGLKELGKALVARPRPYMYYENGPQEDIDAGDWSKSFPSGHTTMAFTGAAFTSYVFSQYFPDSPYKIPVIAGSFTLAAATGLMRILSGNHFITDVLAGALIGTASGLVVPILHRQPAAGVDSPVVHRTASNAAASPAGSGAGRGTAAVSVYAIPGGAAVRISW